PPCATRQTAVPAGTPGRCTRKYGVGLDNPHRDTPPPPNPNSPNFSPATSPAKTTSRSSDIQSAFFSVPPRDPVDRPPPTPESARHTQNKRPAERGNVRRAAGTPTATASYIVAMTC